MSRHICALKHLSKPTECTHNTFNHLKGSLRALAERIRQAVGVIGVARHAATVHASHAAIHTPVATIASVHRAHRTEAGVWRRICAIATIAGSIRRGTEP